jgi:hypothetical protein
MSSGETAAIFAAGNRSHIEMNADNRPPLFPKIDRLYLF